MSQSEEIKVEVNIDHDLVSAAEAELAKQPQTVDEMIEKWVYLGRAAANQLTEYEQLLLISGSAKVTVEPS